MDANSKFRESALRDAVWYQKVAAYDYACVEYYRELGDMERVVFYQTLSAQSSDIARTNLFAAMGL